MAPITGCRSLKFDYTSLAREISAYPLVYIMDVQCSAARSQNADVGLLLICDNDIPNYIDENNLNHSMIDSHFWAQAHELCGTIASSHTNSMLLRIVVSQWLHIGGLSQIPVLSHRFESTSIR